MTKRRWLIAGAVACLALVLGIAAAAYAYTRAPAAPAGSISGERALMERQLSTESPAKAYADFKRRWDAAGFSQKHNMAHLFGSLLFAHAGLSGISVCDADFNYGCYHGFIIEAIADEGFPVIPKLMDACEHTPIPSSCEHGVGHGIVEYLNHTDLSRALETCGTPPAAQPITGCLTGVFMEYNEPVVFDDQGNASTQARPIADASKPDDICPTLAAPFQPACYFSLAQWWYQVYGTDYARMGRFCAAGPYSAECFEGIGNVIAPSSGFDPKVTIRDCSRMPTAEDRSHCLVYASSAFGSVPEGSKAAAQVCAAALPADQRTCTPQ